MGRLRVFREGDLRLGAKVDDEVLQGIVLVGHLVRPQSSTAEMLEGAIAASKVDVSLVNIITTYPGGRKVLQDAEVASSAKLAGQEARSRTRGRWSCSVSRCCQCQIDK